MVEINNIPIERQRQEAYIKMKLNKRSLITINELILLNPTTWRMYSDNYNYVELYDLAKDHIRIVKGVI